MATGVPLFGHPPFAIGCGQPQPGKGSFVRAQDGHGRGRFLPALLLASALLGPPLPALALDPPLQISQYAHTSWTTREGAELGLVYAMAQTPDGYLWIAGSFGIFRFDGLRFTPWQPPNGQTLPSSPYSLLVSRDGTLWIGTFAGLSSWNGRDFVRRHPEVGADFVTSLLEARDGTVWAGLLGRQRGRLCALRDGEARCMTPEGGFGTFVWSLVEDRDGTLWVGAESGVWRWDPEMPRRYAMPGLRVADLTTTVDGRLLVGVRDQGLKELAGDRLVPHAARHAGRPGEWLSDRDISANKLLRARDGGLWIGSEGRGLIHVQNGLADTFTRGDGLSGNIACSLFEDREGNIWYGSHKGLDRFRKLAVTTLTPRQGLPHELTRSVLATTDGSIWVATNDGLARWKDEQPVVFNERDGLPDAHVQALYQDVDGRLWVGTERGLAYFANGRFIAVDGGPSDQIHSITGDDAGNLWLAGNKGLAHLHRGRLVENRPWGAFGRRQQAQVIVADRRGLWMGFWDGGVLYVKDGKVEATYTAAQGLGSGHISTLRLGDDGALWVSTGDGGLSRIQEGRITSLSIANGLPCNRIHWSMPDLKGSLWLYTLCGLVRISQDDVSAWLANPSHRVTPTIWRGADGVPLQVATPAYYNPSVARDRNGKLWSVGVADVQLVDPENIPANAVPPPVHIETLVTDHQTYAATNGLRLPPLVRDISIEFAALTLTDPRSTRFQYRLEGHDSDWQVAVDRRLATYTNLAPGHYRFHVKAANNSGLWNEEGAQFEFSIEPAFYQRSWFRIACAILLAALAWGGFQLRLHMRLRRMQQQLEATLEARVAERTRIARDLHDTLLQRFHGLLLQFQAASNLLPERPRESKQVLTLAIDQVAEAITEGRDTVKELRSSESDGSDLADALRTLAQQLADQTGHATSAAVMLHGTPDAFHPLVHNEVFRIAGEAMRNAFHHAGAAHIDVDVAYDARELRVSVRDDGQGIDPEILRQGKKEGHYGLSGMRERAALVGGKLSISSSPETGTVVELRIPGAQAYLPHAP